ncbi:hypothetical protein HRG_010558 [Hirsutella rhossiliensis]|uniref:Uncharacterized protein n=1 Tax=Hirsutella rhossiliensis TaxID=111463 RepID=A0A9P8MS80_9HYPO|nr:uncharacterized protein HRG_10558 [Hirsutella rhossiliensis]KAH0958257.1 hypothetical protein HRG_10558 [Hirsutella rhossiliensis]
MSFNPSEGWINNNDAIIEGPHRSDRQACQTPCDLGGGVDEDEALLGLGTAQLFGGDPKPSPRRRRRRQREEATPTKDTISHKAASVGKTKPLPAAGTREAENFDDADPTGGLKWLFYATRPGKRFSWYADRVNQIRYVVHDATKYAEVLRQALECKARGEKLLVYCGLEAG